MSDSEKIDFKLPLLTAGTFPRWKYDMKIVLQVRGLWEIATGTELPPDRPMKGRANKKEEEAAVEQEYKEKLEKWSEETGKWMKKDAKAREVITRSLDECHHQMIRSADRAFEMMALFTRMYEHASSHNVFAASQRFTECKWKEGTSIMVFIAEVKSLAASMAALGNNGSESTVISKIISSLPPSYDMVRESLEVSALAGGRLDLTAVTAQLVRHEERIRDRWDKKQVADDGCGLAAKQFKFGGKCHNCGRNYSSRFAAAAAPAQPRRKKGL